MTGTCTRDGCDEPIEFPGGEGEHCIWHCAEEWAAGRDLSCSGGGDGGE